MGIMFDWRDLFRERIPGVNSEPASIKYISFFKTSRAIISVTVHLPE